MSKVIVLSMQRPVMETGDRLPLSGGASAWDDFGRLLRDRRLLHRLSQLELASAAAISSRHLSSLHTGRSAEPRDGASDRRHPRPLDP